MKYSHFKKVLICLLVVIISIHIQAQQKKIGVYFQIDGPALMERNYSNHDGGGSVALLDSSKINSKFLDILEFYKYSIANPTNEFKLVVDSLLRNADYNIVYIQDDISNDSLFPIFKKSKKDFSYFRTDLTSLKEKYDVDSILLIRGRYGIELEKAMFINFDKNNSMLLRFTLIDLHTNKRKSSGQKTLANRIPNWNQPPNYSTLVESCNDLFFGKAIPIIKKKYKI